MTEVIQGQRNWNEFKTSGNVGVITTTFTEQMLNNKFNIFQISPEQFIDEIELNGLDTVFIDNDLFEADHQWRNRNRGNLVNYCKNNDINLCVVLNTEAEIASVFKRAFVMKVNVFSDKYYFDDLILNVPLLVDTDVYNPVDSTKRFDILYYSIGKMNVSPQTKLFNQTTKPNMKIISEPRFTRHNFKKFSSFVKKSSILYICKTDRLDSVTLKYIENIAYLNSTYVVYDFDNDNISNHHGFNSKNDSTNFNFIKTMIRNPFYMLKKTLKIQRDVLINSTFLLNHNFYEFITTSMGKKSIPTISVISSTNRKENLESYFKQLSRQKDVKIEVNLVTHGFKLNEEEKNNFKRYVPDTNFHYMDSTVTLGMCLNKSLETATHDVVAKIDDDDYYLEHYLIDQWMALNFSDATIVGKSDSFYHFDNENIVSRRKNGEYYQYSHFVMGATIMGYRELINTVKFADIPRAVDTNILRRIIEKNGTIFIGHPFEMCVYRTSESRHTWQVTDLSIMKNTDIISYDSPYNLVKL